MNTYITTNVLNISMILYAFLVPTITYIYLIYRIARANKNLRILNEELIAEISRCREIVRLKEKSRISKRPKINE